MESPPEPQPKATTAGAGRPRTISEWLWQVARTSFVGRHDTNPAFQDMTPRQVFDKRVAAIIPMKREQTPEDIGWAAVFLASEEARNITGQALNVDGGSVRH